MQHLDPVKLQRLPERLADYVQKIQSGQIIALLYQDFSISNMNATLPEDDAAVHWIFRRLMAEHPLTFNRMLEDIGQRHHDGADMDQEHTLLMSLTFSIAAGNFFRPLPPIDRERALHMTICLTLCHLTRYVSSSTTHRQSAEQFHMYLSRLFAHLQKQDSDSLDSLLSFCQVEDPDTLQRFKDQPHGIILLAGDSLRTKPGPFWVLVECLGFCICITLGLAPPARLTSIVGTTFRDTAVSSLAVPRAAKRLDLAYKAMGGFRPQLFKSTNEYICLTCAAFYGTGMDDTSPVAKQFKLCSGCSCAMYCSQACAVTDWKGGHKLRCHGKQKAVWQEREKEDTPGRKAARAQAAARSM